MFGKDNRTEEQKQFGDVAFPILIAFFAIIALWVFISASPAKQHYNPDHSEKTYNDSASVSKLPPNVDPKTNTEKEYTQKEKEQFVKDRSDLAAQWAMAHFTWINIGVASIGICFVVWAVIEGRRAARYAEKVLGETKAATVVAINANRIAEKSTIIANQAWLTIDIRESNDVRWYGECYATNIGKTPAVNVTWGGTVINVGAEHFPRTAEAINMRLGFLNEIEQIDNVNFGVLIPKNNQDECTFPIWSPDNAMRQLHVVWVLYNSILDNVVRYDCRAYYACNCIDHIKVDGRPSLVEYTHWRRAKFSATPPNIEGEYNQQPHEG